MEITNRFYNWIVWILNAIGITTLGGAKSAILFIMALALGIVQLRFYNLKFQNEKKIRDAEEK